MSETRDGRAITYPDYDEVDKYHADPIALYLACLFLKFYGSGRPNFDGLREVALDRAGVYRRIMVATGCDEVEAKAKTIATGYALFDFTNGQLSKFAGDCVVAAECFAQACPKLSEHLERRAVDLPAKERKDPRRTLLSYVVGSLVNEMVVTMEQHIMDGILDDSRKMSGLISDSALTHKKHRETIVTEIFPALNQHFKENLFRSILHEHTSEEWADLLQFRVKSMKKPQWALLPLGKKLRFGQDQ